MPCLMGKINLPDSHSNIPIPNQYAIMKKLLLILLLFFSYTGFSQSFSINTDGSIADTSAILDVKSTTKGILVPRLTQAQRSVIYLPATGLIIYQTDNTAGYYYNAGTPAAPTWLKIFTTNDNFWSANGTHIYNNNTGNVGIANTNPRAPLSFSGALGSKISLWDDGNPGGANYGMGIQSALFQIYCYTINDNIAFGYGGSTSFNEVMRIKAAGRVGIGMTDPQQTLSVATGMNIDQSNSNNGAIADNVLRFGSNSGEAISSNRVGTDNLFGLDFYTGSAKRMVVANGGNVGIGITTPTAKLHVADGSVVFSVPGDIGGAGPTPVSGAGRRMMWYADKAAFRVGYVDGAAWDAANVGNYSFGTGYRPTPSGAYSFAAGLFPTASGQGSVALGACTASGLYSQAMGPSLCVASGNYSLAIGQLANASGERAIALGAGASSGFASIALGDATASANSSYAMGWAVTANASNSVAIGNWVSTNGRTGSMVLGDGNFSPIAASDNNHQLMTRFAGGYKFFTNSSLTIGAQLLPNANAWSTISDVYRKENFLPVDGESVLQHIRHFQLGSWNYKGQDASLYRHYGPMAQEFFAAFGRDEYGTIGNDTTINQADFDGINLIAIQALEKRTKQLQDTLQKKDEEITVLRKEMEELKKMVEQIKR